MISVLLVSRQEQTLQMLGRFLKEDEELELIGSHKSSDAALEQIDIAAPDVLIIHSPKGEVDELSLAERVAMKRPRTFIIFLLETMTVEKLKEATAAGCRNVREMPSDPRDFCSYIHLVYNTESGRITALNSNASVARSSKVIAIYGAKGGLGKTTLAVNLAIKLAEQNKKVALVDLDLQFGDVHIYMDMDPKETISDLMQEMGNASIDSIRSYMSIHSSGVHVLCAPKSPEYADVVSGESVQKLLGILRTYYDFVLLDLGANFADSTLSALDASTQIMLVTGLDISILKNSKVAMTILDSLGLKKKVRVIINRAVEIKAIGIADVQRIVDAPILARIPSDYLVAVAALNQGHPFVQSAPKAKLSLSIGDIAWKLISGKDDFDLQQLTPRERKALIKKYATKEKSEKKSLFKRK